MSETTSTEIDEPRFAAPADFGLWCITVDGETTLCGKNVESHHISGKVDGHDAARDCYRCMALYGHMDTDKQLDTEN